MERTKRRKAELEERSKNESLRFLSNRGIQKLGVALTNEARARMDNELRMIQHLGLASNLLMLKEIVDGVRHELYVSPEPSDSLLSGSMVAYSLGIVPDNPLERGCVMSAANYSIPMQVSLRYDNDVRNQVVQWVKAHGYKEVKTRLGQPILKMDKMVVEFKRIIKA